MNKVALRGDSLEESGENLGCSRSPVAGPLLSDSRAAGAEPVMATINCRSTRYESLDAWRGFACLLVVVFHATAFNLTANLREVSSSLPGSIILLMSYLYHGV